MGHFGNLCLPVYLCKTEGRIIDNITAYINPFSMNVDKRSVFMGVTMNNPVTKEPAGMIVRIMDQQKDKTFVRYYPLSWPCNPVMIYFSCSLASHFI